MDKKQLQAQELDQVSGGDALNINSDDWHCEKCGVRHSRINTYPLGFFVKVNRNFCNGGTVYYKCPDCGYEWTV